ncbi:MAG: metallophosphoesterase [Planctomycetaceae bacterium]|jgi:3',5'-cyclic AMP phosphodiesterase CpdA|nr:metallophosphoesterase [Planctomycetaceae bacterium]
MPITFPAIKRRDFLLGTFTAGVAAAFLPQAVFADKQNENHWVFLSDTHVPSDIKWVNHGSNANTNFTTARDAVIALKDKPSGVIVTGDFAHLNGGVNDYKRLKSHIELYRKAGIPVHVALGNHDNLDNFLTVFKESKSQKSPVANKHVLVIETPNCNLFLLDALYWVGAPADKEPSKFYNSNDFGAGFLGAQQLRWLKQELTTRKEKPAILFAHHNLDNSPGALMDREQLWSTIKPFKHVKAYIYGHTHIYKAAVRDGIHLINLPALGWEFQEGKQPLGWTDATISKDGIKLKLHTVKPHPQDEDERQFTWLR